MASERSLVSIIITTYYRTDELRRAIEGALGQTYEPIETLVVDDSGEQFAESIVSEYEDVEYIPHAENQGQIASWHTGLEHSDGQYVQFHDDDDRIHEEKIEKQVNLFHTSEGVGTVYCGIRDTNGWEKYPLTQCRGDVLGDVLAFESYPAQTTTMLISRDVLEQFVPMVQYEAATDDVLKFELAQQTQFDYVNELLVIRGDSEDSQGYSWSKIDCQLELMQEYEHLYDQFGREVRDRAQANCYLLKGNKYLDEELWSPRAITAFLKSNYLAGPLQPKYLKPLLASLAGRPGFTIGRVLEQWYQTLDTPTGT